MTSAAGLVGLTKTNLREQALAPLRTAITSGQLPPQTPMVETELSERLQISRGTLREAMRQLQQQGLPHCWRIPGTLVRPPPRPQRDR